MVGEWCPNCEGVKCMDCRTRTLHDDCQHDCPECCDPFNENDAIEFTRHCHRPSPAVTRDELAGMLRPFVSSGSDEWEMADELLAYLDIRPKPEGGDTDG